MLYVELHRLCFYDAAKLFVDPEDLCVACCFIYLNIFKIVSW